MKITELIDHLQTEMLKHGDVDVFSTGGCGCCSWSETPRLKFDDDTEYEDWPPGLYLN